MRKVVLINLILLFFMFIASTIYALSYNSYINNSYNYRIIVPESWKKEELTLTQKHFMYASKDVNTEIKVRAFKTTDDGIEQAVHQKKWDLKKIDPGLNNILETKKITIKKNITGKLLIFEYTSLKKKFLQRVLVSQNNGILYIIECRSPQNTFYKHEDAFTTALASFKYLGKTTQRVVQKKEEKKEKVVTLPEPEDNGLIEEPLIIENDEEI